jgi:hypothetical protein
MYLFIIIIVVIVEEGIRCPSGTAVTNRLIFQPPDNIEGRRNLNQESGETYP